MLKILVTATLFFQVAAASADPVTAAICLDVLERHGVSLDGCDALATDTGDNSLSQSQIESNIFFPEGGSRLDDAAVAQISLLASVLETQLMRNACIRLVGHTDVSGPAEINKATGLARANAVAAALRGKITSPARIESVHSEGEDNVLPNIHPRDVLQRRVAIWARQC